MNDIDEMVDRKSKLSIFTFLRGVDEIESSALRKRLGLTEGNPGAISQHSHKPDWS
ncbi:hypothetical protein ACFVX3_32795 [Rhodococcus erythropolis]